MRYPILDHLASCCARNPTRCRLSLLPYDTVVFISVLHLLTPLLQLGPPTSVSPYVLLLFPPPAVLATVLGVLSQSIDTTNVLKLLMDIHLSPHISNAFDIELQEKCFAVPSTSRTSMHTSSLALRQHFCLGVLLPLSTWHEFTCTAPYPGFNLFI